MTVAMTASGPLSPAALARLLDGRQRFLEFVRKRVQSPEAAEDILQSAFLRSLEKGSALRGEESVTAWFYRVLRNAIIDYYRRTDGAERASDALVHELQTHVEMPPSIKGEVCQCVSGLLKALKPEYREALETVDLSEGSLADLGARSGISPNNAAVRVHRARAALRKQVETVCNVCATHGCLDCSCRSRG